MAENDVTHRPRVMLVTGGAGFIGSNFVRWLLAEDPCLRLVNLDALTYAGNLANLADLPAEQVARHRFVQADIRDSDAVGRLFAEEPIDTVVHFAAESHVDRSIDAPRAFVETNVLGTCVLLQAARAAWGERNDVRFHQVSTDEVYGSLGRPAPSPRPRPTTPAAPTAPPKPPPTIWCAPGTAPSACRCW